MTAVVEGAAVVGGAPMTSPVADKIPNNNCSICMSERANVYLVPCCHLCICSSCISNYKKTSTKCPVCRADIIKEGTIIGINVVEPAKKKIAKRLRPRSKAKQDE